MISVCLASYNGSSYIQQQLKSILPQLSPSDEVIVVDDCSTDVTIERVQELNDNRIELHRNTTNCGAVLTFERAISLASGDVVFLSDQDDIWYPDKVQRFIAAFDQSPEVTLVVSDARVVNGRGDLVAESYFATRGGFSAGLVHNIIKCKFLGCTMAFRQSMVRRCLPFPPDIPMHDVWMGCLNAIYGKTCLLDLPLMDYRRHDANVTPHKRRGLATIAGDRWRLVKSLFYKSVWGGKAS
jgi:glycosyltransferase involved in cell wall biosynthesis